MGVKVYDTGDIRNIALVGHGFSGKTSLGEAMLLDAGVTTRLGHTEQGTSTFDFEPEEQKRGGSIASAFAWVEHQGRKINILDTPGDQNFLYDALAALRGADSAVVVVSAVDGVEVQTERFWHRAEALALPRVIFVNKMDRERADAAKTLADIEETLGVKPLVLQVPIGRESGFRGVVDLLTGRALFWGNDESGTFQAGTVPADLVDEVQSARERLVEDVASTEDALLEKYMETFELSEEEIAGALEASFKKGTVVPVFFGAAARNIGVQPLLDFVVRCAPGPLEGPDLDAEDLAGNPSTWPRRTDAPFLALVIRTFIDEFSGKVSVMRILSGTSPEDGQVLNTTQNLAERLGTLHVQRGTAREPVDRGVCGDIVSVAKLKDTHTNDCLSDPRNPGRLPGVTHPQPMMAMTIKPATKVDEDRLKVAVERLIEEDPTLSRTFDEISHQMILNGMGQAHLEASIEKMKRKFKVAVNTDLPAVPYRETLSRAVKNVEGKHKKQTGGAGQFGVCFLDVEPLERGKGFEFVDKIFGGSIPRQFIPSVEKGILDRLKHGILAGYPVTDLRVSLIDGKYHPVDSKDIAFQRAGSKGLRAAMEAAGMKLLEPFYKMEIVVPTESMGDIMGDVTSRRGRVLGMDTRGKNTVISAVCPLAEIQRYAPDLHAMTGGKGSFTMEFFAYEDVPGAFVDKVKAASPYRETEEEAD
ncbi:MAG: elongation factor G [Deltaproteobacteria bacterium]|nr:elongation factor G [Deltaproteobacteria bacterium]